MGSLADIIKRHGEDLNSNSQEQPKLDLAQQIPVDTLALTIDPKSLWLSQELRKTLLNMRYVM